jgi:hypothetical protein
MQMKLKQWNNFFKELSCVWFVFKLCNGNELICNRPVNKEEEKVFLKIVFGTFFIQQFDQSTATIHKCHVCLECFLHLD